MKNDVYGGYNDWDDDWGFSQHFWLDYLKHF